jgi:hypothetical protein
MFPLHLYSPIFFRVFKRFSRAGGGAEGERLEKINNNIKRGNFVGRGYIREVMGTQLISRHGVGKIPGRGGVGEFLGQG